MKCACYDEVKLDSMKVTITPAQMFNMASITFTMCTFWDRKASPKECGFVGGGDWMANGTVPTALEIFNNEGTIKSAVTSNTIYGYKRYCKASSIIEKGGYHDSSILYNPTAGQSPTSFMYLDAWMRAPLAFSPALYVMLYSPATFANHQLMNYTYKVEYTFTFRNPKSDMDWFLLVESPGYINPDDDNVADPNMRATRTAKKLQAGELLTAMQKMYNAGTITSMNVSDATRTIDDLFVKPEVKKFVKDKEDIMDIEDDPGTS